MHNFSDITLDNISKIEGRAKLYVALKGGHVEKVEFQISEYKRFYTWAIKGKNINALSQMVSRICGTCSIAHLLCSIEAIEHALHIIPSEQTRCLRKLLMYGLMLRDHALHIYLFALPDYFGKDSLLEFDESDPLEHQLLHDAFALKKAGNILSTWIGGRAVHALFPKIGGFIRYPDAQSQANVIAELKAVRENIFHVLPILAEDTFKFHRTTNFAALCSSDYNFLEGPIKSTHGWEIAEADLGNHVEHVVIPYSMSSGYTLDSDAYMVGALARLNLNRENLHSQTKKDADVYLSLFPSENIYYNSLAQAIEMIHCIDHSLELLEHLDIHNEEAIPVTPKRTTGVGVIEAPRGLLFYKLNINEKGIIEDGQIVVPTSQNQINIEQDVRKLVEDNLDKSKTEIERMLEMLIRAYDPCMSCASHFLQVQWKG